MLCPILISGTKVLDAFTVHEKHVEEDDVLPLATVLIHRPRFSVAVCVILGFVHALVHVGARLAY